MNEHEHEELRSLLGAYALNATDAFERRRVERHLSTCDECENEVRTLSAAAAELAWLPEPADAGEIVERVARKLPMRPRKLVTRLSVGIAAVSVVAAGVLGGLLVNERNQSDRFADVVAAADAQVRLGAQGGFEGAGVLHLAKGEVAVILEDLPDPGRDRAYQLWAISGGKPRSVAVIDGDGRVVGVYDHTAKADRFALTIEPSGGSPVPTTNPVLVGVV